MTKTLLLITLLYVQMFSTNAQTWIVSTDFPSLERDDAVCFVINHKAYCGTGLQVGWSVTGDFYSFDFSTETWTTIASLPLGNERQYACAFAYKGNGYLFGGTNAIGEALNDLWIYNPTINSWAQLATKPNLGLSGACCFVIDSCAYIVGGSNTNANSNSEVWAYNIYLNSWTKKTNFPFGGRWRASATELNGKGYLIFGKDSLGVVRNEMYEYNAFSDTWQLFTVFNGIGRTYASLVSIASSLAIACGIDSLNNYHNDLWYYNSTENQWYQQSTIPSNGRKGGLCFGDYNTLYYTTGIDSLNNRIKQTWKIENPTNIKKVETELAMKLFPNPTSSALKIEVSEIGNYAFGVYDINGKEIMQGNCKVSGQYFEMDIGSLNIGTYNLLDFI